MGQHCAFFVFFCFFVFVFFFLFFWFLFGFVIAPACCLLLPPPASHLSVPPLPHASLLPGSLTMTCCGAGAFNKAERPIQDRQLARHLRCMQIPQPFPPPPHIFWHDQSLPRMPAILADTSLISFVFFSLAPRTGGCSPWRERVPRPRI